MLTYNFLVFIRYNDDDDERGEKKHTHTKIKMKSVWIISYESDRRRNT